jgi:hypothetical protein
MNNVWKQDIKILLQWIWISDKRKLADREGADIGYAD